MQVHSEYCRPASVLSGKATWCEQKGAEGAACRTTRCLTAGAQAPYIVKRALEEEYLDRSRNNAGPKGRQPMRPNVHSSSPNLGACADPSFILLCTPQLPERDKVSF
jgi:hypothetical protein